ncbi:MAG: hypothetical protein HY520_03555 [Candidatus Aenigmarchaeota archaeon]|nr:hypothetical protein [Candidatus Aenigmarchaeota archaeon]
MDTTALREVGLTPSEIRLYLALLETRSGTNASLVRAAGIASSKFYEVMGKLLQKGLATQVVISGVRHYNATPPERLREYCAERRDRIEAVAAGVERLIPFLEQRKTPRQGTEAEVFQGWKGVEAVYRDMIATLRRGETDRVFGAGRGADVRKMRTFFRRINRLRRGKGIRLQVVANDDPVTRETFRLVGNRLDEIRYLPQTTPAEINLFGEKTAIVLFLEEPVAILIRSSEASLSFRQYFDALWALAAGSQG